MLLASLFLHGDGYSFWSGVANDVPVYVLGVLPVMIAWYRKNECHTKRCHRLGHFPYRHKHYCHKHHPVENGSQIHE